MMLSDHLEGFAYNAGFSALGLENPDYPVDQLGDLTIELSGQFRVLAIAHLLVRGEPDSYYHNLIRSGRARLTYLQKLAAAGRRDDHHQVSGRFDPLLDAIAAGDLSLAREIAALSPEEWCEGREYEDDYCYARFLHEVLQPEPSAARMRAALERWERWLETASSPRFEVARALEDAGQEPFDEAFDWLLDARAEELEANRERGQLETPEVEAERRIFVEGLAILRLAELRGLATEKEYRFCPALARVPMQAPFPGR
jgi:hypothetical protein